MWAFIRPGLKHGELAALRFIPPTASLLFVAGGSFAFLIVVPIGVKFLSSFVMDGVKSQYSLASYTSFVLFLVLAMGLLFECPLVLMLLARLGLVTKKSLVGRRRHIVLGCFVIAAVVTPTPDMITQSLVALPMWLLFEGTLFFMKGTEP
jgi:sec-independent protein translocase protein TatC